MACRVLLVGSGITSAITASILRNKFKKNISLVIWDKARGMGGRMSTSRSPSDSNCIADLGAQYITLEKDAYEQHREIYESLLNEKLLEPLCGKVIGMREMPSSTKHFVAPNGMNSLVKHFLKKIPDEIHFEHHVSVISSTDQKWKVETKSGATDLFDIVILTMPIPQILELTGTIQDVITGNEELNVNLKSVKYSSRYALGLFFNSDHTFKTDWDVKYIYDDEIFRYVSLDNKKRNRPDSPSAAVFHTSIQFGLENVNRDLKDIEKDLIARIGKLFPDWPEPSYIKCHRWRYSQVLTPYKEQPGSIVLTQKPLLLAGGDGFKSSHIDDCISSAETLTDIIFKSIEQGYCS